MSDERLQTIQRLQFSDKPAAESALLDFVRETFPDLGAEAVDLRPKAVSLNSFNGLLTVRGGRQLFFKTHVEPGSVIGEYYNASLLAEAGYPIIQPVYSSTEYGKQLLIYEVIDAPSVFDVAREIELGLRDSEHLRALGKAQKEADRTLMDIYRRTLAEQSAEDSARAPIHQLFYHRLGGRYASFYAESGQPFALPGAEMAWSDLLRRRWVINGNAYQGTLEEAIERARHVLNPAQACWSVVGHGDAHNGNVFYTSGGLVYFDPAFGGRHNVLLDIVKPLFHNVYATWMYHPAEVAAKLHITWEDDGTTIRVQHNYEPSQVRKMFLLTKYTEVLLPLLRLVRPEGWRETLKLALMCCPLLTMNLADRARFPPEIGLLGLSYVVEMGLTPDGPPADLNRLLAAVG
jgi:hypothetical protein